MRMSTTKWLSGLKMGFVKALGFALVMSALSATCSADPHLTPEMDPGLATSALALLGGGLAIFTSRGRRD